MAEDDDAGYAFALSRVTELEVDLAAAKGALERTQSDNLTLKDLQTELTNAYRRLQEQFERLRGQLRQEQDKRTAQEDEHQKELAQSRSQLAAKSRECADLERQARAPPQGRELDALRLQLAEDVEEPYVHKVRALEGQLAMEQRKVADCKRQMDVLKTELDATAGSLRDELAEVERRHKAREKMLERQVAGLEADVKRHADVAATSPQLRTQVHDLEGKVSSLQKALQEQEHRSERERAASAQELRTRTDELSTARRRAHDLQVQNEQATQEVEKAVAEGEHHRREASRSTGQLDAKVAEMKLGPRAAAAPGSDEDLSRLREELARVKASNAAEREQLTRNVKAAEEQRQAASLSLRRAEAQLRQLEGENEERERDIAAERVEAERQLQTERATLNAKIAAAEDALDSRKHAWRDREAALKAEVENALSRADALSDEVMQSRSRHEDEQRRHHDSKKKHQQSTDEWQRREAELHAKHRDHVHASKADASRWEAEMAAIHDKHGHHTRESQKHIDSHSSAAEALREKLVKLEHKYDAVKAELALTSSKLDEERARFAREMDEACASALREEEQRRGALTKVAAEEHKRQMAKLQASAKKALKKAALKRQEQRQKYQDLARRISQVQQEKNTAVRICEENRNAYELRLAEITVAARLTMSTASTAATAPAAPGTSLSQSVQFVPRAYPLEHIVGTVNSSSRSELRSIAERLDRNAEFMRSRLHAQPSVSAVGAPEVAS